MNPATLTRSLVLLISLSTAGPVQAQDSNFIINEGLSGAWFNADTPGQGFLIDVVPANQFVFAAWFTYEESGQKLGAAEHRWLTAQGNYDGSIAGLTLSRTEGGQFDDPAATTTLESGTLEIEFFSCTEAVARYAFSDGPAAEIPLSRLTPDVFCSDLLPAPMVMKSVTITYFGNEGVVIDDGESGLAIDAIGNFTSPWITVPAGILSQLQNGTAPYQHIGVAAISHNHGDHYSPTRINSFLASDSNRRAIITTQGRGGLGPASQLEGITPARFTSSRIEYPGFSVTVVNTRHFNQFGNDFSGVDNYAYVVEMAGHTILHLGDIDYASDNFQAILDTLTGPVNAVVIPTFNTLINTANRDLIEQFFTPEIVIGAHFQSTRLNQESQMFLGLFANGVVFDQPMETVILP